MLTFIVDLIVPGVGRLLSVTDLSALSVATAQPGFTYGAAGNVTRITDAAGHVRPYESTYEKEGRSPGNAHLRGAAFDIRYPRDAERALCCAALHGAANARNELRHPIRPGAPPHIHVSIVPGLRDNPGGPRGDLPANTCSCE